MANVISSDLQRDYFAEATLTAFTKRIAALGLFSTAFRDVPLEGTDKMQIPYYPLDASASKDFDGSYVFDRGTNTQSKEVTINKRKYQPMSYTSAELARQPKFDPEKLGELRGNKLAEDIMTDILSVVTAANFGNTDLSADNYSAATQIKAAYSAFDLDEVIDLEVIADTRNWPNTQRGLVLAPSYIGNVKKDMAENGGIATYGIDPTGAIERFPAVNTFSVASTNDIPANGENLAGFAVYPTAVLVGFSPITPTREVMNQLVDYRAYTDPRTGLTIEMRLWGDAKTDTTFWTVEVNYGFAVGESKALIRILSS